MAQRQWDSSYHGRLPISRPYQFYQGHLGRETGLLSTRFRLRKWRTRIRNQWLPLVYLGSPVLGTVTATARAAICTTWARNSSFPHERGLLLYSFRTGVGGFFNVPRDLHVQGLWDEGYGLSSLSEKTRTSNRLQMYFQMLHFPLSFLKTLSAGPAGFWINGLPLGRPALIQLS